MIAKRLRMVLDFEVEVEELTEEGLHAHYRQYNNYEELVADSGWWENARRQLRLQRVLLEDEEALRRYFTYEAALELALSSVWPAAFQSAAWLAPESQATLLRYLLTEPAPQPGELERSAVWLKALDVIVNRTCQALVPTVPETVRLLGRIQHGLKRWVWKEKSLRKSALPSRWLIDNEYDVQALLWAILYPVYGPDLVDERYLEAWGFKQPRVDLGIKRLKLIIEVKFAREAGDFSEFEEQVGGDLGIYFKNTEQFDRMVVVVYDDCDVPHPERYESLRNALMQRERIEEVIFIRRPSMIPGRKDRLPTTLPTESSHPPQP